MSLAVAGTLIITWPTRRATVSLSRPADQEQKLDKSGETGTFEIKSGIQGKIPRGETRAMSSGPE
jgi:hypothetical protein